MDSSLYCPELPLFITVPLPLRTGYMDDMDLPPMDDDDEEGLDDAYNGTNGHHDG